jgi:hypothetical protein
VQFRFGRRLRHPFFPALKLTSAADARDQTSALYGEFDELCRAAASGVRVARAVFPLLPQCDPFLTSAQRDRLWELFEVPIYVLVRDGCGRVVGFECEAQEGIHLPDGVRPAARLTEIRSAICECGRPGDRLVSKAPREHADRALAV